MPATLIIADVHNDFAKAEEWILRLKGRYDRVVFTGDYFDSHCEEGPQDIVAVGHWLRESLAQPNRVHLVGNHDLSYLYPCNFTACSGTSAEKRQALAPLLNGDAWKNLRPAIQVDNWLLTHAGVHHRLCAGLTTEQIVAHIEEAWTQLIAGDQPPLFACGFSRGGRAREGGITWQDFGEFRPTPGVHQIFAHTPADTVRLHWMIPGRRHILKRAHRLDRVPGEVVDRSKASSVNVCLDTELNSVALLEDGKLSVFADHLPGGEQMIVRN